VSAQSDQSATVRHLSKDDPKVWAQMPEVERAAYDRGWLDASAAMFAHLTATRRAFDERCVCGNGEAEDDRGAVLRCPVHGPAFDEERDDA
jgi:hypothetical protein